MHIHIQANPHANAPIDSSSFGLKITTFLNVGIPGVLMGNSKIDTKMVVFRVRNTFVNKFANLARLYFPHFTSFHNQTWQFY